MRGPAVVMVGIAVVVGLGTVIGGRYYLERASVRPAQTVAATPAVKTINATTVVVAAGPLRFGTELSSSHLKEVTWPADAVPPGSSTTIAEFLKAAEKRVVLNPIDANEPVLSAKVTGPGQRATLSALIAPGMTAVSIPLSETQGIAGLVMPGDRVNVMLTRTLEKDESYIDTLLQNVRVVAVDQGMDQRNDKPAAIRSATLEVMPQDAKRLALAGTVGSLSLALKKAGEQSSGGFGRLSAKNLLSPSDPDSTASHGRRTKTTVTVTRNGETQDYSVISDKDR
jgi:pilus assembly protein CpaB